MRADFKSRGGTREQKFTSPPTFFVIIARSSRRSRSEQVLARADSLEFVSPDGDQSSGELRHLTVAYERLTALFGAGEVYLRLQHSLPLNSNSPTSVPIRTHPYPSVLHFRSKWSFRSAPALP